MSQYTYRSAIIKVKYLLRDRKAVPLFTEPEYMHALDSQLRIIAPKIFMGDKWYTGLITIVPGTDTYTIGANSNQPYQLIRKFRFQSDGLEVPVVSPTEFESWRSGDTGQTTGDPQIAMLYLDYAQLLQVRFWPTPSEADSVDVFASLFPLSLFDPSVSIGTLQLNIPVDTALYLDDQAFEALIYSTASDMYARIPDDNKPFTDPIAGWNSVIRSCIKESRIRRNRFQSGTHVIRRRRW